MFSKEYFYKENFYSLHSHEYLLPLMMNKRKYSNLKWFTKVGILLLYVCFFLGQLNFNYDCGSLVRQQLAESILQAKTKNNCNAAIIKIAKPCNTKVNLHLNKRFQPESFILGKVVSVTSPIELFTTKSSCFYTNPILPTSYFTTYSLRGPPAVA